MSMFRINENIIHKSFGEGTIVKIAGTEHDRKLVVRFNSVGPKVLLEKIAKDKISYNTKVNTVESENTEVEVMHGYSTVADKSINKKWLRSFNKLKEYLKDNPDPDFKCKKTGKRLYCYYWLYTQRKLYRDSMLEQNKIDLLNKIVDLNEYKRIRSQT